LQQRVRILLRKLLKIPRSLIRNQKSAKLIMGMKILKMTKKRQKKTQKRRAPRRGAPAFATIDRLTKRRPNLNRMKILLRKTNQTKLLMVLTKLI